MIITIDGPIATGKSTIAKHLAREIGFIYFDTGAMYRCIAYAVLKKKIDLDDLKTLQVFLDDFRFDIKIKRGERFYFVEDEDVTMAIRGEAVTSLVSKVAALPSVRVKLVSLQRDWAEGINAVFEGRDLGTVVFPHADIKIFLTGNAEVRARRRFEELSVRFPEESKDLTFEKVLSDITKRDTYDSTREISPLRQAADAYVIDTSNLTIDEIVFKILEYKDTIKTRHSNH
ncbi:MAG TPA: (d)CMP kinase [Parachlamydiaceae bacterium]|nr:(d)CMP kinase [Parachlamydiaceae bacterium]